MDKKIPKKQKINDNINFSVNPEKFYQSFTFWNKIQIIEYFTKKDQ